MRRAEYNYAKSATMFLNNKENTVAVHVKQFSWPRLFPGHFADFCLWNSRTTVLCSGRYRS